MLHTQPVKQYGDGMKNNYYISIINTSIIREGILLKTAISDFPVYFSTIAMPCEMNALMLWQMHNITYLTACTVLSVVAMLVVWADMIASMRLTCALRWNGLVWTSSTSVMGCPLSSSTYTPSRERPWITDQCPRSAVNKHTTYEPHWNTGHTRLKFDGKMAMEFFFCIILYWP